MEQRIVTIRRKTNTRIPVELSDFTTAYLGSGFSSETHDVLRGLNFDEEFFLLPKLVGCDGNSHEFVEKSKNYWSAIDVPIPVEGKRLNITHEMVKTKNKYGVEVEVPNPQNAIDYITWRFALVHSEVAKDIEEVTHAKGFNYYIEDSGADLKLKTASLAIKNVAKLKYLELSTGANVDVSLLRALAINTKGIHNSAVPSSLDELSLLLNNISESHPEKFIEVASDPSIKARAFINELVDHNIVEYVNNDYYDRTVGEFALAGSTEDFIKYISSPKNNIYKASLQAKLQAKKGK